MNQFKTIIVMSLIVCPLFLWAQQKPVKSVDELVSEFTADPLVADNVDVALAKYKFQFEVLNRRQMQGDHFSVEQLEKIYDHVSTLPKTMGYKFNKMMDGAGRDMRTALEASVKLLQSELEMLVFMKSALDFNKRVLKLHGESITELEKIKLSQYADGASAVVSEIKNIHSELLAKTAALEALKKHYGPRDGQKDPDSLR